jgi:hypothetical protein
MSSGSQAMLPGPSFAIENDFDALVHTATLAQDDKPLDNSFL